MTAKLIDITETIRKRQNSEPVPALTHKLVGVLLSEDYSSVEQLAAIMLAGRTLRLNLVDVLGEERTKSIIANALTLAKLYDISIGEK